MEIPGYKFNIYYALYPSFEQIQFPDRYRQDTRLSTRPFSLRTRQSKSSTAGRNIAFTQCQTASERLSYAKAADVECRVRIRLSSGATRLKPQHRRVHRDG